MIFHSDFNKIRGNTKNKREIAKQGCGETKRREFADRSFSCSALSDFFLLARM